MEAKSKDLCLEEAVEYLSRESGIKKKDWRSVQSRFKFLRKAGKDKLVQNILTKEKFMSPWPKKRKGS